MPNTTFTLDAAGIARTMPAPAANVRRHWPGLQAACLEHGLDDRACLIAVLATIGTETSAFEPIDELGDDTYFTRMYETRTDLGNDRLGDGTRYHGRGFIQLTGRGNYRAYGEKLGVPLEEQPELALDAAVAARILGVYFEQRGIAADARKDDWQTVRRKVNGGLNGWDRFQLLVQRLGAATEKPSGLAEGAIGPDVVRLKQLLERWGETHPLPQPLKDTPFFGPAATQAVKAFQAAHGIRPTGKVGAKTWTALMAATQPVGLPR